MGTGRNHALVAARHRLPPGANTQQAVADAIADLVQVETGIRPPVDADYISKLERGEITWPNRAYRTAFRRHFGVASDGDLGFYCRRSTNTLTSTTGTQAVAVPAWTADGQLILVTLPRRGPVEAGQPGLYGLATASVPANAEPRATSTIARVLTSTDSDPIEHLSQLRRVLIDSDNLLGPHQILPTTVEYIHLIQQLRQDRRGEDHRKLVVLQTQFAEFAGWLAQDLGDHGAAQYWTDRALQWSHEAADPDMTAFVLARKSQLAGDMHDPTEAVDLARASRITARLHLRLLALGETYGAHGHALRGEHDAAMRGYDHALDLISRFDSHDSFSWGAWLDEAYVQVHRARSLDALGQHAAAAAGFQAAIAVLPAGYRRDRGVYLARQATAHAGSREPEQAAAIGLAAIRIATSTGSGRILTELAHLDARLERWQRMPEVAKFHEAFSGVQAQAT